VLLAHATLRGATMQHPQRTSQLLWSRTFSPVHSARKLAHVLGTTSARSSITKRPAGVPPMDTSKNTFGRAMTPQQGAASLWHSRRLRFSGVQ